MKFYIYTHTMDDSGDSYHRCIHSSKVNLARDIRATRRAHEKAVKLSAADSDAPCPDNLAENVALYEVPTKPNMKTVAALMAKVSPSCDHSWMPGRPSLKQPGVWDTSDDITDFIQGCS